MAFDADWHGAGVVALDVDLAQLAIMSAAPPLEQIRVEIFEGFDEIQGIHSFCSFNPKLYRVTIQLTQLCHITLVIVAMYLAQ